MGISRPFASSPQMSALFDSTLAALRFALNYSSATPRPLMNKMAADGKLVRVELEDGRRVTRGTAARRRRQEPLHGLDGAGQAALIAKQLDHLTSHQKDVVIAQHKQWVLPCACRSPCCSGYRQNPGWSEAVERICEHLKSQAELTRVHGRKGLSTHPLMRRALVERFFIPGKTIILAELADRCGVTPQTVITHKKPIEEHLEQTLRNGLVELDQILHTIGIVGQVDF
jgi:hypothetical protein